MGRTAGSRRPTAAWISTERAEAPSRRPRARLGSPDRPARGRARLHGSPRAPWRGRGSDSAACSRVEPYQAVPREPPGQTWIGLDPRGVVEIDDSAGNATFEDPDDRRVELRSS